MSRIASLASSLFEYMKQRVIPEIAAEVDHSISHGASELAAGLFTERGFVMYGPHRGQAMESAQQDHQPEPERQHDVEHDL